MMELQFNIETANWRENDTLKRQLRDGKNKSFNGEEVKKIFKNIKKEEEENIVFLNNKDNKENEEYLKDLLKQPTCRVDFFYCFDHSSFRSGNNHTLLACYLLYGIYTFPQHRPKDFYLTEGGHDDRPTDHTAQTSPWENTEEKKTTSLARGIEPISLYYSAACQTTGHFRDPHWLEWTLNPSHA